jgi:cellulose biosynthesis protein BcsQ
MINWAEILEIIPQGTSEADLEDRFIGKFLTEGLGFAPTEIAKNKQFTGSNQTVVPDYTCCVRDHQSSELLLVVEDKAVKPELMPKAIEEVKEQMLISGAKFGLATNGLQIQLWQRYGSICVPRTSLLEISSETLESIIDNFKDHLNVPKRALTTMFWVNKGGVGKTTITANIAAALAQKEEAKILLVNFDLQGDLNILMNFPRMSEYNPPITIFEALDDAASGLGKITPEQLIRKQKFTIQGSGLASLLTSKRECQLDIIPGDKSMQKVERGEEGFDEDRALQFFLEPIQQDYDYIFIDASPQWEKLGKKVAYASDIVIPIVDNSGFSVEAVKRLKDNYLIPDEFPDGYPPRLLSCIINCRFQGQTANSSINEIKGEIESLGLEWKSDWVLKNYAVTVSSIKKGMPVVFSYPNQKATKDFQSLAASIFSKH